MNTRIIDKAFFGNTSVIKLYQGGELVWPLNYYDYEADAVDLGLPSHAHWSKYNLGSSSVEGYGDKFAWGELFSKLTYTWDNYKWYDASTNSVTKYHSGYLELEDDVANVNASEHLRIPNTLDFEELKTYCTAETTTINGITGVKYTSNVPGYTDKWIFFATTEYSPEVIHNHYWTRDSNIYATTTPPQGTDKQAVYFPGTVPEGTLFDYLADKYIGHYIRPLVMKGYPDNCIKYTTSDGNDLSIGNINTGEVQPGAPGPGTITRFIRFSATKTAQNIKTAMYYQSIPIIPTNYFYNKTTLTSIVIPRTVEVIDSSAFKNCTSLVDVSIPFGVTTINSNAFAYCKSLTTVYLPSSISTIGAAAFYQDSSLSTITIQEGVKRIEDDTFNGCPSLKSITLPQSTEYIGTFAFYGNYLQNITILNPVPPELGSYIFGLGSSIPDIYVPAESVDVYKTTTGQWTNWSSFASKIQAIPQ